MKKKTNKKVASALAMLMLSAAMLGTSTYAWFTMNKKVTVTGMEVKTKVGSNLLIAADTITANDDNQEAKYTTTIAQVRKCLLEPSSTINGVDYWYTVEASADGQKLSDKSWIKYDETNTSSGTAVALANETAGKANADYQFNSKYLINGTGATATGDSEPAKWASKIQAADMAGSVAPAYGYIDYIFYIKATSDAAGQKVVMTDCNLLHNDAALGTSDETTPATIDDRAWRVAVFSQTATANTDLDTAVAAGDLVTILAPASAENHTAGQAVTSATAKAALVKSGSASTPDKAVIGTISASGATAYYKVTVRLWLEGEDKTCTSATYAKLTSAYKLGLEFKLEADDANAVTEIKSALTGVGGSSYTP